MEEKKDIREIADENGLQTIETTSEASGYPQNLKRAIIGFDTIDEALELAEKYPGLEVQKFEKRDGWQLWYRTGHWTNEPFTITANLFNDDYREYTDAEDFFNDLVKPSIDEIKNISDLADYVSLSEKAADEIDRLEDDEVLIWHDGNTEVFKRKTMRYEHDSRTHIIGVIEK